MQRWEVGAPRGVQITREARKKHTGLGATFSLSGFPLVSEYSPDTPGWLVLTYLSFLFPTQAPFTSVERCHAPHIPRTGCTFIILRSY